MKRDAFWSETHYPTINVSDNETKKDIWKLILQHSTKKKKVERKKIEPDKNLENSIRN